MVGILIITHAQLGQAFLATLEHVYKQVPEAVLALDVQADENVNQVAERAMQAVDTLNSGDGVLVLTDLYGATPSNIAARLARLGTPVRRDNCPMFMRGLLEVPAVCTLEYAPESRGRAASVPPFPDHGECSA